MKNRVSQSLKDLVSGIRYGHPFLRTIAIAIPILLAFLVFFVARVFPLASADSIRSALTLITEIIGVLLGAVLVIIGLSIDQVRGAETVLLSAFPKYHRKAEADKDQVVKARQQMVQGLLQNKFILEEKELAEGNTIMKKSVLALSSLTIGLEAEDRDSVWNQLAELGYSEGEIIETTWFESILGTLTSYRFFRLLKVGLDPNAINEWCTKELMNFSEEMETSRNRDGIIDALNRYESSRDFLGSWRLSITIVANIITLLISLFTVFGVTKTSYNYLSISVLVYISIIGFLLSISLLSLSLRKMLTIE